MAIAVVALVLSGFVFIKQLPLQRPVTDQHADELALSQRNAPRLEYEGD